MVNNKKIAVIILTIFIVFAMILVSLGSCGGIRYLMDNRNTAVVHADDVGTGESTERQVVITIPLTNLTFRVGGFRSIAYPDIGLSAFQITNQSVYTLDSSLEFVWNSNTGLSLNTTVINTYTPLSTNHQILLFSSPINDTFLTFPLTGVVYDIIDTEYSRRPLSFTIVANDDKVYTSDYGALIAAKIDVIASTNREGNDGTVTDGSITLILYFENNFITYTFTPYNALEFGYWSINYSSQYSFNKYYGVINASGFATSIEEVYQEAYQKAIDDNRDIWYDTGYNQGVIDGAANANDYSFMNLIGAVIDVPVQAFIGLTDFELFGFNMSGFYKAFFALALILIVMRIVFP